MDSLSLDSLSDGFVGRLLFFEAPDYGRYNDGHEEIEVPEDLVRTARAWHAFRGSGGDMASEHPSPWRVETQPEAEACFRELRTLADAQPEGLGRAIWGRTFQKARQLALVRACSVAPDPPAPAAGAHVEAPAWEAAVRLSDATWVCELAAYLTRRMIWLAHIWVWAESFRCLARRPFASWMRRVWHPLCAAPLPMPLRPNPQSRAHRGRRPLRLRPSRLGRLASEAIETPRVGRFISDHRPSRLRARRGLAGQGRRPRTRDHLRPVNIFGGVTSDW